MPRISVITPSYNQARYLERTICSVLDQNYPNLEYIIIDGGSTDGSVEIIKKYEKYLKYWISEPDHGQSHAINKGLSHSTGEWVCWQNSDDIFYPQAFHTIAKIVKRNTKAILVVGNMMLIDEYDREIRDVCYVRPTYRSILAEGMVLTNQAAFWKRDVHKVIGYFDETLNYGFDYEWFLRLLNYGKAIHINRIFGALRMHNESKTYKMQIYFDEEYEKIRVGHKLSRISIKYYQLRRLVCMLAQGKVNYILRGGKRRIKITLSSVSSLRSGSKV